MRAINLLPNDRRREADARGSVGGSAGGSGGRLTTARVAIVGGSLAAIVCGFIGFTFVGARSDVAKRQDTLDAIQQQVAEAQAEATARAQAQSQSQQPETSTALPASLKAQLDAFNMVASARVQWDQLLGDVSRVIPEGSWLSSLALQITPVTPVDPSAPPPTTPAAAPTPTGFVVTGFALSQPVVAKLLRQLALVPMLSDVTLQRSERANVGTDRAFQFTLSANVRLDGAS